jgi:hypothetical protein
MSVATLVGPEMIGFLEVDRVDARSRQKLGDFNRLGCFCFDGLELFFGEGNVATLLKLVAFDHVVALDNRAVVGRADVLLLEARAALLVQEIERHLLAR